MLPKGRRLTSPEVTEVIRRGRPLRATHLSMKFLPSPTPFRVSAVVSKSVAKRAVRRNHLRRALYQALTGFSGTGTAVVFVQKIPQRNLVEVFTEDLAVLLKHH